MNPVLGATKVDKLLTQFSIAYRNTNYISEMLMPRIKVIQKSGKFAKYGKDGLRLEDNIERAPGTRARSFDYTVSQGTYVATEKSLEKIVPDEFILNSDDPFDPKRDAVTFCIDKMWLAQEAALASAMADTNIMTQNTTLSGTDQWSDIANSDPFDDIREAQRAIQVATGTKPNVLTFGYDAYQVLKVHPDITDRIKFIGITSEAAMRKAIADLFEVEEVLVGDAVKNTANEGQADSMSFVWGKHAWLSYRPTRPSLMQGAFGYTISDMPRVVDSYRDDARKGEVIRVCDSYDQTIVDAGFAYLIKDAVA